MNAETPKKYISSRYPGFSRSAKWIVLLLIVIIFILLLYPRLMIQSPAYSINDIAEHTIIASRDFFIKDRDATEISRQQAASRVLTVYDYDPRISKKVISRVHEVFGDMRQTLDDLDMTRVTTIQDQVEIPDAKPGLNATLEQEREHALRIHKPDFEKQLGIDVNEGAYNLMIREGFSASIANLITRILSDIFNNGIVGNKEVLLREGDKGVTLRDVTRQTEKAVYTLRQFYGPDQAKTMVRVVAQPLVQDLDYNMINMIVDVAQRLLQPNITLNRNETEARIEQAMADIKPVMYQIKAGETLLRKNERITSMQLDKLQAMEQSEDIRRLTTSAIGTGAMLAGLIIVVYLLFFHQPRMASINTNRNMVFMGLVFVTVFCMVKLGASSTGEFLSIPSSTFIFAVPAAAASMLVCIFLGFTIALPFGLITAVCSAMLTEKGFEFLVYFFIHISMGAYWVKDSRERKHFITAGTKLGLLNLLMTLIIAIYQPGVSILVLLWNSGMAFAGGVACGIITVGVAPLMEMLFGYTTDITLLELANLDRPILRRLMFEAPGTYHHSMIVGSLVEAAAAEIGANPLLARVSGYYHDIGKVKKPLYFIENQKGGPNRHDKLAPSMSSLILIAHIKDGVDIARRNKLGQIIIDAIQQHHGTSLISYFYEKAKQLKGEENVNIDDFRYPGPRPQTKEAGLVMLADVVEAASRTLENPTPARIQGLVQNLINKIFSDGQLDNCELTLRDLHRIAKSFNTILYGIHHHRVEYSESATKENGKGKHGGIDRQSAKKTSSRDQARPDDSQRHLKRLGLS
jgi:putative nucleotidyltransferase with HDIG domain